MTGATARCGSVACLGVVLAGRLVAGPAAAVDAFEDGIDGWEPLAQGHWAVVQEDGNAVLKLERNARQRKPVRRPGMYILAPGGAVSNVTATVRARTLRPASVKNRDICILFGFHDDTHFYYAHISSNSDNKVHNVIMRVDGPTRTRINRETSPPPLLTDAWHTIALTHASDGEIVVRVDGVTNMTASDTTYPAGRVGLGSFDDTALFDDFRIDPAR